MNTTTRERSAVINHPAPQPTPRTMKPKTFEQWAAEHRWEPSPHYVGVPRYDGPGELDSIPTQAAHRVWDAAREGMVSANAVKQPQWVSVKERLPEEMVNVLVVYDEKIAPKRGHIADNKWWVEGARHIFPRITHWMPMPEPPMPEQDDGFEAWWHTFKPAPIHTYPTWKEHRIIEGKITNIVVARTVWQAAQKAKEEK